MKIDALKNSTLLFVLAIALAAPLAFAQTDTTPPAPTAAMASDAAPPSSAPKTWKELDANKDGKLSRDEVAGDPTWSAEFDAADTNKDGSISKAEFKKHSEEMKKK